MMKGCVGVGFCSVYFGMFNSILGLYVIGANCTPHPYYSSQREGVGLCTGDNLVDCAISLDSRLWSLLVQ